MSYNTPKHNVPVHNVPVHNIPKHNVPVHNVPKYGRPRTSKPVFYQCGICDHMHNALWDGDCRQDDARFNPETLDDIHGVDGWEEIDMKTVYQFRRRAS